MKDLTQKRWLAIVFWAGLFFALAYTTKMVMNDLFLQLVSYIMQLSGGSLTSMFSPFNFGAFFLLLLSIGVIFLIVAPWLNFVSFTGEVVEFVFGSADDGEYELSNLPRTITLFLALAWGLFFIILFILPFIPQGGGGYGYY